MGIPATLSSVPAQTPYIQYVATSGQTVFPYPFEITQDSDLVAVANGTTLATDSGYTLSGVGNATGGNLTFTSGRTAGDIITLYRDIPIERLTQFAQNGGFSSTAFNAEFNNVYLLLQQLQTSIDQCLQIPNTNNPAPTTSLAPASYAGAFLGFDSQGNPAPVKPPNLVPASGSPAYAQSAAEQNNNITPTNTGYEPGNILRYGADPTGMSDSTSAIQTAINLACKSNGRMYIPAGTYKFTSGLTTPSGGLTGCSIVGDGAVSVLSYQGAITNSDCWLFGDGANNYKNVLLSNFRITSTVTMTGGAALHLQQLCRSVLDGVIIDGQDGPGNFYHGIWFDQVDDVDYVNFQVCASQDGLRVNGSATTGPKADLFLDQGKIAPANGKTQAYGLHVGGAFGGLQVNAVDIIGSGTNLLVDTALAGQSNRELTFGSNCAFDTSTAGSCVYLNDAGTGTVDVFFNNTWIASGKTHGLEIANTTAAYHIQYTGGTIFNNQDDGIHNAHASVDINLVGTKIWANGQSGAGYGVNNASGSGVVLDQPDFAVNASGDFTGGGIVVMQSTAQASQSFGADPSVFWTLDSTQATITIANTANAALPAGSGLVLVTTQNQGNDTAVYLCGGGAVALLGSSANTKWVAATTTPASGKTSLAYDSGTSKYRIYNNIGSSCIYGVLLLRTNNGT